MGVTLRDQVGNGAMGTMRNAKASAGGLRRAAMRSAICLLTLAVSGCGLGTLFERIPPEQGIAGSGAIEDTHPITRAPEVSSGGAQAALESDLANFKERLLGLSAERIDALFGAPSLARAEPPATIWQYRRPSCTIDIFMFEAGGVIRVDHVDVRGVRATAVDERACFKENLQKKAGGETS